MEAGRQAGRGISEFNELQLVIIGVVEFTHQPVDIGWSVAPNVGDEEGDEFWRHVIEHRAVSAHFAQDLPCRIQATGSERRLERALSLLAWNQRICPTPPRPLQ